MATKPKKSAGKTGTSSDKHSTKKESSKPDKQAEEDGLDEDIELDDEETGAPRAVKKGSKTTSRKKDDEEEEDLDEGPDDWEKPEEEEEWDPDFEEFDLPKSTGKKAGKKPAGDEDDFKFEDDEFKDLLSDKSFDDDEEDDY